MRKSATSLTLLIATFLLTSASKPVSPEPPQSHPTATHDGGLAEFNRRFVDGCRKFDPEGTAALWADDGVDLLPGMDPMIGKATILKWLNGLVEQSKGVKILQCDVAWQGTEISGDVAYEWGINTQTITTPDHPDPLKNKGKITLILRKQPDGSWKLALESWNNSPREKG